MGFVGGWGEQREKHEQGEAGESSLFSTLGEDFKVYKVENKKRKVL